MWERNIDNEKKKPSNKVTPIYQKPKILLIDLPDTDLDSVRSAGFNASAGTFGSPYKVKFEYAYQPVIQKAYLPNFTEQEIIIIDLTAPETIDSLESERVVSKGEYDWWAKGSRGKIDPRPMVMMWVRDAFDRILDHDGMFVIFAQPLLYQKLIWAKNLLGHITDDRGTQADNWSFLSILSRLEITSDHGEEIIVPNLDHQLFHFLRSALKDARYTATLKPTSAIKNNWAPIANSKFKECVVGGLLAPENSKGRILILPQISKDAKTIVTLLCEVLPELSPHLFPHIEGPRWVKRDEYELDSVLKYKTDKIEVQKMAKRELEDIDKKITEERDRLGFLHGIITNTSDDLVESVKSCLEFIGFEQVIDVDKEIQNQGTSSPKQEDLRVQDKSPTLLVEIKGSSGRPGEADTMQVVKYVPRRKKDWGRTDVHGVLIINHQHNVPALERDNRNVFTEQQIEDAQHNDVTILTTWDLFLLTRGMVKWKWNPKAIQELFYRRGRMPNIPAIYKPIGKIVKYWEKPGAVGVQISENKLNKGQRIGYVIPDGYLEEEVSSLQVENRDVEEAVPGQLAGIKTMYHKNLLRKGTIVCVVEEK
jgi:protein gp37